MLLFQIVRPHSVGVVHEAKYETYSELETFLEPYVERKCDAGWNATEFETSSSKTGCIELVHDEVADSILLRWLTK